MERFKNNATSTLSSGVNNSSDPVTVSVASGTPFPTNGNFRIKIDNEILKVTSVSGNDFTASRAQEGTSIASHTMGTAVTLILTNESLDQTIKDRVSVGNGDTWNDDNNFLHVADDAPTHVINQNYWVGQPFVQRRSWDPDTFDWFAQGSASYNIVSEHDTIFSVPYTVGEQLRGIAIDTTGTVTIDAWFQAPLLIETVSSYHLMGINIGNDSDDKKYALRVMNNASTDLSVLFQYFTDNTTASAAMGAYKIWPRLPIGLRMEYHAGNDTCTGWVSIDGINWLSVGVRASVSSDFTPTNAGVHFENNGSLPGLYTVSNVWIR